MLLKGSNQLVLMSRELDPLTEVDAHPTGSGEGILQLFLVTIQYVCFNVVIVCI